MSIESRLKRRRCIKSRKGGKARPGSTVVCGGGCRSPHRNCSHPAHHSHAPLDLSKCTSCSGKECSRPPAQVPSDHLKPPSLVSEASPLFTTVPAERSSAGETDHGWRGSVARFQVAAGGLRRPLGDTVPDHENGSGRSLTALDARHGSTGWRCSNVPATLGCAESSRGVRNHVWIL